jgi:hypothetical protein
VGGACRSAAPGEELGFGLPERRRGRLAVEVLRGDCGGVITLLAWGLVADNLLFGLVPSVGRFMPTRASDALMGLRVHHLVSPGAGAITLIGWAGALGVVGIALSVRQDIN